MLKLGIVKLISSKFRIRLLAWHHNAVCNVGIIVSIHAWSITDLILFVLSTYYILCKVCIVYFTAYQEGEDTIFACHHYLTLNGWIRAVVRIVSQVVMYGFELANCDAYFFLQLFDCLMIVHPREVLFVGIIPVCRKFHRPGLICQLSCCNHSWHLLIAIYVDSSLPLESYRFTLLYSGN